MGSREGLSVTMEIVHSPQVIQFIFQRLKDVKFPPGMHFCKSRSQAGHLIVRLLQRHDKLFVFPSMNQRQPSEWQIQPEIMSFIHRRFYTFYCHFCLIFFQYPNTDRLLFLNYRLLFFNQLSNPAGIDFLDISAICNSHSCVH